MEIYVLNDDLAIEGIYDEYESIIWTARYYSCGDFELYMPLTAKNLALFQIGKYVVRDKDTLYDGENLTYKNVMIVEKRQITTDIETGKYLIVTGRCLKSILARRVVAFQQQFTGTPAQVVRSFINAHAGINADEYRKISNLNDPIVNCTYDYTITKQATGDNLMSLVEEICKTYDMGWDIYILNGKFVCEIYVGTDRSYGQNVNSPVVFSNEFDNLLSSEYIVDKTNQKTLAYVAGEGEGANRKIEMIGDGVDLKRYEIFVDSRNSSTNDGAISDKDYALMLTEEGKEALAQKENSISEEISGEIDAHGNYELGVDYFLGDVVQVITEDGISMAPRIIEIIDSEDESGTSVIPTYSTNATEV